MDSEVTVSCYKLSFKERLKILFSGELWLGQANFCQPLQPQLPSVYKETFFSVEVMTQEDMPNIREIMDKSFEAGYKDAMDFSIDWLKRNANHYTYNTGGYDEYIPCVGGKCWEDLKKAMEENLCKGISK